MKLEKGMYVRFKDLTNYQKNNHTLIDKIKFISEVMYGLEETLSITLEKYNEDILKKDIIKSSKEIIDLIEENDILMYEYDNKICISKVELCGTVKMLRVNLDFQVSINCVKVLKILTKEQFESMAYEVEE